MDITRKIALIIKYCLSRDYRDYRYIRTLQVFDPDYFFSQQNEELRQSYDSGIDPLWSYFLQSRHELSENPVASDGSRKLSDPHPLFDTRFYVSTYIKGKSRRNPFAHYLIEGWKKGWSPSPFFNPDFYFKNCGWDTTLGDPLSHYNKHGVDSRINPGNFFDSNWYLDKYLDKTPVLHESSQGIFRHYKVYGARSGKSPIPVFEPETYLDQLSDQEFAVDDPLLHYLVDGERSNHRPNRFFNPKYYRRRYMAANDSDLALSHYLTTGVYAGYEPDQRIENLGDKPLISLVVPVYNPAPYLLNNCIRSVYYQAYPYWELCLVDDCSTDEQVRDIIKEWAQKDDRIKYLFNSHNKGISATTQKAAEMSTGKYLGFLDNDDELTTDCLYQVVRKINKTGGEVFYTDEDLVGSNGTRHASFSKPDFNAALLYSHNYITHFVVVLHELFKRIGGLTSEFDGAQDYDLMLRLAENTREIHRIPLVLYHWRAVETSTSIDHEQKPYAHEAGKQALQKSLQRIGITAEAVDTSINFHYRLVCSMQKKPSVSVLFFSDKQRGGPGDRTEWLRGNTRYENCSITIVPDSFSVYQQQPENKSLNHSVKASLPCKADIIQKAILNSSADYIALLAYGAEGLNPDWLDELVDSLQIDDNIGIVCGRVSYNDGDGRSYAVADIGDSSASYFVSFLSSASRHQNGLHNLQFVHGCDWQICLLARSLFNELGGFDTKHFPNTMAMVDLSYRAADTGIKTLYTPYAMVSYDTISSIVNETDESMSEEKRQFQIKHKSRLKSFEPYYNLGQLSGNGITEEQFYSWLSGSSEQRMA